MRVCSIGIRAKWISNNRELVDSSCLIDINKVFEALLRNTALSNKIETLAFFENPPRTSTSSYRNFDTDFLDQISVTIFFFFFWIRFPWPLLRATRNKDYGPTIIFAVYRSQLNNEWRGIKMPSPVFNRYSTFYTRDTVPYYLREARECNYQMEIKRKRWIIYVVPTCNVLLRYVRQTRNWLAKFRTKRNDIISEVII